MRSIQKNAHAQPVMMPVMIVLVVMLLVGVIASVGYAKGGKTVKVVATMTDYAAIARFIGGEHVEVFAIAKGDEDVHFVRPKPSYAQKLSQADLFLTTGLDLEMWAPSVIDMSRNPNIREGQIGYVAVADGMHLLEIPTSADRSQGGVHIYGNPHVTTSPLNWKVIAHNIAIGLKKVDPDHGKEYAQRAKDYAAKVDEHLFGAQLVGLLGGDTLTRLAESGNLITFLESKSYKGGKLIDRLGGWMKLALPLRNQPLVTYHKNWVYFTKLFGLNVVGEVETKPAIPPSPGDVQKLLALMRQLDVKVVLAANYFDESKIRKICTAVGATPLIVPLSVNGEPGVEDNFKLMDLWLTKLVNAYK